MARQTEIYLTGYRSIEEALKAPARGAELLISSTEGRVGGFIRKAREAGLGVRQMSRSALRSEAGEQARGCALRLPRGYAAAQTGAAQSGVRHVSEPANTPETVADLVAHESQSTSLILLLDHVTDAGNYGAILRSADQFGVDGVVTTERRAAHVTAVVLQSSAGAAAHVPIVEAKNLAGAIETLKAGGYWVYGADMAGSNADAVNLSGRTAIVMGAEGPGLSRLVRERSDALVRIPASGHADSFNVSVATGILLYEVRRQQGWFKSV